MQDYATKPARFGFNTIGHIIPTPASVDASERNITLIAAMSKNFVIGNKGDIPWKLPEDMQHFKRTTTGHTVIMGRETYESFRPKKNVEGIQRGLPNRRNIVLTRQIDSIKDPSVEVAYSIQEALDMAGETQIFVIGGGKVYEQFLPYADDVILTEIDISVEGDAYFPPLDMKAFQEYSYSNHKAESGLSYRYVYMQKKTLVLNRS